MLSGAERFLALAGAASADAPAAAGLGAGLGLIPPGLALMDGSGLDAADLTAGLGGGLVAGDFDLVRGAAAAEAEVFVFVFGCAELILSRSLSSRRAARFAAFSSLNRCSANFIAFVFCCVRFCLRSACA